MTRLTETISDGVNHLAKGERVTVIGEVTVTTIEDDRRVTVLRVVCIDEHGNRWSIAAKYLRQRTGM
jgi:preprotein translocase subunit YajC